MVNLTEVHPTASVGTPLIYNTIPARIQIPTPIVPINQRDWYGWLQQIARLNQALMGKINPLTTISFNQSAGTTTLTDSRLGVNSLVALMPITANAASAAGSSFIG